MEFFQFPQIPRAHHHMEVGIHRLGDLHGAPSGKGIRDGEHKDPRLLDAHVTQHAGIGGISIVDRESALRRLAHGFAVQVQHDIGNLRVLQDAGEVLSVQAVADHDYMVLDLEMAPSLLNQMRRRHARQPMSEALQCLRPARQLRRPLHQERCDDHGEHGHRQKDLVILVGQQPMRQPLLG